MLDLGLLPEFLLTVALIELTPGPNMAYLAMVSSRWGRTAGLVTVAGITLGLTAYLVGAVLGVVGAILRLPWLNGGLHWAGVGYLIYLAIEAWTGPRGSLSREDAATNQGHRMFTRGLVANLLNPKVAVFYVALLPNFANPSLGHLQGQFLSLGLIHILISLIVHCAIVLSAASTHRFLQTKAGGDAANLLNRAFAVGLLGIALWLAWSFLAR